MKRTATQKSTHLPTEHQICPYIHLPRIGPISTYPLWKRLLSADGKCYDTVKTNDFRKTQSPPATISIFPLHFNKVMSSTNISATLIVGTLDERHDVCTTALINSMPRPDYFCNFPHLILGSFGIGKNSYLSTQINHVQRYSLAFQNQWVWNYALLRTMIAQKNNDRMRYKCICPIHCSLAIRRSQRSDTITYRLHKPSM